LRKRRFTIYLSRTVADRFMAVARVNGAKSALVEKALDRQLDPDRAKRQDEALARRIDGLSKGLSVIERDVAIATETLSLFVRYYLMVTPPVSKDDQEAARALGQSRFETFVVQVGRRLATDQRLVSEVLETIVATNPDLLGAGMDEALTPRRPPQPVRPANTDGAVIHPFADRQTSNGPASASHPEE
jgi:hypothetical protein